MKVPEKYAKIGVKCHHHSVPNALSTFHFYLGFSFLEEGPSPYITYLESALQSYIWDSI